MHLLIHILGFDDLSGGWYGFWSGFGSDLGEFAIIVTIYRKLNCHVGGCKRIGLHHINGTVYITCKKHHPTKGNTLEHIHKAHKEATK